jgi:hypothetical protein
MTHQRFRSLSTPEALQSLTFLMLPALCLLMLATFSAGAVAADGDAPVDEARQLLEETLRSRGGIHEMGRLMEIQRQGELVIATAEGEKRLPMLLTVRPPRDLMFESGEGEARVRREVIAGEGWETRGDGPRRQLDEAETAKLVRLSKVDEAFLARSALAGELDIIGVEDAGPGQVDPALPAAAGRAILLRGPNGAEYRLVVPEGGGLPLRVDYRYGGESEQDDELSDVFARWRIVDGLLFPAEVILYREAQALTAGRYEKITVVLDPAPSP